MDASASQPLVHTPPKQGFTDPVEPKESENKNYLSSPTPRRLKKGKACVECYRRKTRCSGEMPCDKCLRKNVNCAPQLKCWVTNHPAAEVAKELQCSSPLRSMAESHRDQVMKDVGFITQDKDRDCTPGVSPFIGEQAADGDLPWWHIGKDEVSAAQGLIELTEGPRLRETVPRSDTSVEPDVLSGSPGSQSEMGDIAPPPLFSSPADVLEPLVSDEQVQGRWPQTIDPCCLSLSRHGDAGIPLSTSSSPLPQRERSAYRQRDQEFQLNGVCQRMTAYNTTPNYPLLRYDRGSKMVDCPPFVANADPDAVLSLPARPLMVQEHRGDGLTWVWSS